MRVKGLELAQDSTTSPQPDLAFTVILTTGDRKTWWRFRATACPQRRIHHDPWPIRTPYARFGGRSPLRSRKTATTQR